MDDASVSVLHPHLSAVHKAIFGLTGGNTEAALSAAMKEIVTLLGFDCYHYVGNFALRDNEGPLRTLSNLPLPRNEPPHDGDHGRFDPVFEAARTRLTPIIWRPAFSATTEQDELHSMACDTGIGDGIIFPINARNGGSAALGLFVAADRGDATRTIAASLGDAGLTAAYLHESMARLTATTVQQVPKVPLTRREIECLYWIAHHKSNWAISKIIGISEHGVVYYVRRLMWKLDAQNRYHAVARANACGMLSNVNGFDH